MSVCPVCGSDHTADKVHQLLTEDASTRISVIVAETLLLNLFDARLLKKETKPTMSTRLIMATRMSTVCMSISFLPLPTSNATVVYTQQVLGQVYMEHVLDAINKV